MERDISHLPCTQVIVGMWKWPEATSGPAKSSCCSFRKMCSQQRKRYVDNKLVSLWHHTSWFRDWLNSASHIKHLMCQRFFCCYLHSILVIPNRMMQLGQTFKGVLEPICWWNSPLWTWRLCSVGTTKDVRLLVNYEYLDPFATNQMWIYHSCSFCFFC